jgi:hypothetical protein
MSQNVTSTFALFPVKRERGLELRFRSPQNQQAQAKWHPGNRSLSKSAKVEVAQDAKMNGIRLQLQI